MTYYEEHREEMLAKAKKYNEEHKEEMKTYQLSYRQRNLEKERARQRTPEYREKARIRWRNNHLLGFMNNLDEKDKKKSVAKIQRSISQTQTEIKKCVLLCPNCHALRHLS